MRTENMVNRMKELEKKVAELAKELNKRRGFIVQECIPMYEFMHGNVKEAKIVQTNYGFSIAVTCVTHFTVAADSKVIEHKYKTFYYPLYKDYDNLYDGKVINKDDLYKMYMLILTRPGYPVLFRVSLTPEKVQDNSDYDSLLEEYHKSGAELVELSKEIGIKYNILSTLILY